MPIPAGWATPTPPAWAPTLEDVAAYVPQRTLVPSAGANNALETFDTTTRPTSDVVTLLIGDACDWVLTRTGVLHSTVQQAGGAAAAIWAASAVESGFPEREAVTRANAIDTAAALLKRAESMLTSLVVANKLAWDTENGTVDTPYTGFDVVYSFPDPAPWGDTLL